MPKFRKKPVIVEAMQFTNETKDRVFNFITCNKAADFDANNNPILKIQTLEGIMTAEFGDWVVRGIKGEFYPVKNDIFNETYEDVELIKKRIYESADRHKQLQQEQEGGE